MENKYINNKQSHIRDQIIDAASKHFGEFLTALGYDWKNDPHMVDTPLRVAKSYVNDLHQGVFHPKPKITSFPEELYDGIVFSGNIDVNSSCSHHFLPFIGKAHVAYIGKNGNVIGLSKLNRIVDYWSRRPQLQERLTMDIHGDLCEICDTEDVAVIIESAHMCACVRGVKQNSIMKTAKLTGAFLHDEKCREEFYQLIKLGK